MAVPGDNVVLFPAFPQFHEGLVAHHAEGTKKGKIRFTHIFFKFVVIYILFLQDFGRFRMILRSPSALKDLGKE